jgi:hypothetical protein
MSNRKYQVTFHRTEEIVVEVEAESEFEARKTAIHLVSGESVRAQPQSVPETVDHSVTVWSVYKMVEMGDDTLRIVFRPRLLAALDCGPTLPLLYRLRLRRQPPCPASRRR